VSNTGRTIGWIAAVLALGCALALDPWAWRHLALPGVYDKDWGRLLRVMGSLVLWIPLAVAVWLERTARGARTANRAGLLLMLGPALAGAAAEVLKLLLRRERPGLHEGAWVFRAFTDRPFDTRDLGLPSSHAMVAFGGAAVLARLFPGAAPVAYLLAAGTAITRVLAQAHFLSDAVLGALAGWTVGALLWKRFGEHPTPPGSP
jgi:membrane-associated phospholipid phosphatase